MQLQSSSDVFLAAKVGTLIFFKTADCKFLGSFRNRKSTNLWGVLVRKSQIRRFVMINPQIANPKISLMFQSPNRKSAKENSSVSGPDPHWFAYAIIIYSRK